VTIKFLIILLSFNNSLLPANLQRLDSALVATKKTVRKCRKA